MTSSGPGQIRVLAAVIQRDDRYLVCQRPAHKRHGGLWEFPGGKLEPGETLLDAARREMSEELGVDVVSVVDTLYAATDSGSVFLIEFVRTEISGEPQCIEHAALCWLSLADMSTLDLAPADRGFVGFMMAKRHIESSAPRQP